MSYSDLTDDEPRTSRRGRRRRSKRKRRRFGSFFAVVVSLAVVGGLVAGVWFGGRALLGDVFGPAADYDGPGHGAVEVTIPEGATLRAMGRTLVDADVVASQDAFVNAAQANPRGMSIQAGAYTLMLQMRADDAVAALLNATTIVGRVVIPEGYRLDQIVARIAEETEFTEDEVSAVLDDVDALELPDYAEGPEGFLFPATYDISPDTSAESLVRGMVSRFNRAAEDVNLASAAEDVNLSSYEVVVTASIIEREVRDVDDMPNVAEVIHNRLSGACVERGVPEGLLEMDSTVHYAIGGGDSIYTSPEDRNTDSPYNTYEHAGLPPGPISAPGEAALRAALSPPEGDLCFMVTVNLETGETKFAATSSGHADNRAEYQAFCRESDLC